MIFLLPKATITTIFESQTFPQKGIELDRNYHSDSEKTHVRQLTRARYR
jgi:hypothetical protein